MKKLFEYQRFAGNPRISRMIEDCEKDAAQELTDETLGLVSAAGAINEQEIKDRKIYLNENTENDMQ